MIGIGRSALFMATRVTTQFVGSTTTTVLAASSSAAPITALSAVVGDVLVFAATFGSGSTLGAPGFATASQNIQSNNVTCESGFKVLSAGDISSPMSFDESGGGNDIRIAWALYRGPTSAAFRTNASSGSSPLNATSFTPAANTLGLIVLAHADLSFAGDAPVITSPTGTTHRVHNGIGVHASIYDKLTGYAAETFTLTGNATNRAVRSLELLGV